MNMFDKIFNNKKAEAMAFNVIVGAAIALVVMIIVILIFTSRTGKVNDFYSKCANTGVNPVENTCEFEKDAKEKICECPNGKLEYLPIRQSTVDKKTKMETVKICCVDRYI